MKRLILLFLPFVSVCINAEELKFVTVLSSPVGTFNKLEAVNPAVFAKSPAINFCTSIGNGGRVTLQAKDAAKHPTMNTVNMSSNTELGGNGANYVLNRITMNKGGVLKGSRLLANTLQVNQPTAGKSDNLYINNLTVAGAKTGKLHVNGTESYIETSHADPGMVWSNQYQSDKACGENCKNQYLLKERRTSSADPCAGEKARTYWNGSACVCPSAGRPSPVGYLPEYDMCCYLDDEKKEPCWKKVPSSDGHWGWTKTSDTTKTCVVDYTMGYIGQANCPTCTETCDSRVDVGVGCMEDTPEGGYRGSSGLTCVLSCDVRDNGEAPAGQCPYGHECKLRTIKSIGVTCQPLGSSGEYTWRPQWINK